MAAGNLQVNVQSKRYTHTHRHTRSHTQTHRHTEIIQWTARKRPSKVITWLVTWTRALGWINHPPDSFRSLHYDRRWCESNLELIFGKRRLVRRSLARWQHPEEDGKSNQRPARLPNRMKADWGRLRDRGEGWALTRTLGNLELVMERKRRTIGRNRMR